MIDEFASLDATAQAALVRAGDIEPTDLVESAIERIERVNPELNAVIHTRFDRARSDAAGALPDGPFRGVPLCLKDLDGAMAGEPLHEGNQLLKVLGHTADHDTYLSRKLIDAGFVVVGKTNTPEWGLLPTTEPLAYGPTGNPWDPTRSTGGSSGGSAAAVAAGLVPVAHAGDGGGSIRIPSSHCGLFGLKPSRGRVSLGPDVGEGWAGLVARHVLTRSVRDSAAILDVIAGPMPGDPYTAPPPARPYRAEVNTAPKQLRIGLRTVAPSEMAAVDRACATAAERAAEQLEALGHIVEPAWPAALDDPRVLDAFMAVVSTGVAVGVAQLAEIAGRPITPDDVEPLTWLQYEMGAGTTAAQYAAALNFAHRWTRSAVSWWDEGYDLLLTPTVAEPPPKLGDVFSTPENPARALERSLPFAVFCGPFNITGQPAMSVPVHRTADGLPVGAQLVANQYREDVLFQVAARLEAALQWNADQPAIHA
jgi:amidase